MITSNEGMDYAQDRIDQLDATLAALKRELGAGKLFDLYAADLERERDRLILEVEAW